jgi:phenol 2-monooxygenase
LDADLPASRWPPKWLRFPLPRKGRYALWDYEKMFCPDLKSGSDISDMRGVDRDQGCLIVVRPDQYIAHILPLDAYEGLSAFFDAFMPPKN